MGKPNDPLLFANFAQRRRDAKRHRLYERSLREADHNHKSHRTQNNKRRLIGDHPSGTAR